MKTRSNGAYRRMILLGLVIACIPTLALADCWHGWSSVSTRVTVTGYGGDDYDYYGHYIFTDVQTYCTICGDIKESYGDGGEYEPHSYNAAGQCIKCGFNSNTGLVESIGNNSLSPAQGSESFRSERAVCLPAELPA